LLHAVVRRSAVLRPLAATAAFTASISLPVMPCGTGSSLPRRDPHSTDRPYDPRTDRICRGVPMGPRNVRSTGIRPFGTSRHWQAKQVLRDSRA
jgi:hypothetical protein